MVELSGSADAATRVREETQLVVLPIGRVWAILVNGQASGHFDSQAAALSCVETILELPWLSDSVFELLVSSPAGEIQASAIFSQRRAGPGLAAAEHNAITVRPEGPHPSARQHYVYTRARAPRS